MKVGYVRVSSAEQNTARQEELMEKLGVEKIFIDKVSGKDIDREQLQMMLHFVREGDTVIVESISRLARNTKDLLELIDKFNEKKVKFISQKEDIDTSTVMGKFVITIFGAIAELERQYIKDRQREGIEIAIKQGKFKGRPKKKLENYDEVYNAWKNKQITAIRACKLLKISRATFYRRINKN